MVCAVSVHFGTTNLIVVGDYSHEHTEGGGGGGGGGIFIMRLQWG